MPQYYSPGVYVEEVDAGPRPIQGVSTSVTGVVGVTVRGPVSGKPVLVTSFNEFVRTFGGFMKEPDATLKSKLQIDPEHVTDGGVWWRLAHAVRGFFDNGGQQLYVKRVVSVKAKSASLAMGTGVVSEIVEDAKKGSNRIKVRHALGIKKGDAITIVSREFGPMTSNPTVNEYRTGTSDSVLDFGTSGIEFPVKVGDYVYVEEPVNEPNSIRVMANSPGKWGDDLRALARPVTGNTLLLQFNEATKDPLVKGNLVADAEKVENQAIDVTLEVKPGGEELIFAANDYVSIKELKLKVTRVEAVSEVQKLTITGNPTEGKFKLLYNGESTDPIAHDADGGAIQTSLHSIDPFKGNVTCVRTGDDIDITFVGELAGRSVERLEFEDVDLVPAAGTSVEGKIEVVTRGGKKLTLAVFTAGKLEFAQGTRVVKLRKAHAVGANVFFMGGAASLYKGALVELDNGEAKHTSTVKKIEGDKVTLNGAPTDDVQFVEGDVVRVIEGELVVQYAPGGAVQSEEAFTNLRLIDNADDPMAIITHVNKHSNWIKIENTDRSNTYSIGGLGDFPITRTRTVEALDGGDDVEQSLTVDDFIGVDQGSGQRTGIKALEDIADISIVMVPGMWARSVVGELLRHCDAMKYRVAILDAPDSASIEGVRQYRAMFDSKRAALYHPWVKVRDPLVGEDVPVPPSGCMAGIFSDVDRRRGVHKAPGNEVIKSVTEIAQDITQREQDLLNPKGINALRFFPGRGNRVWGARTISSDSNFRYVNVRRIFNFIERSIDEGTQFVVFEPNDPQLWSRVRQTVSNFLNTQWRTGVLEGQTAAEAYYVACDRGITMSQDDIDNGRLIVKVGIRPVHPAEFLIIPIEKLTADSKL